MSVYTTLDVTRSDAIMAIVQRVVSATDEQLAEMLFELVGREGIQDSMLANFRIVSDYNDSEEWRRFRHRYSQT
jgi:membrane-bound lytic murein transglycosylase B